MNIFITGSNGFIGSHLKEYLNKIYSNYILFTPSSKELNLLDESSGTKKLFGLLPFIAKSLLKGTTLVIDELDAKIHPVLLKYLIMTFSNMEKNKKGAQLIFTSHDLSTMNSDVFRRDEIWFISKSKNGASSLHSLSEYNQRFDKELRRSYLNGRFDGIPDLSEIGSNII